MSSRLWRSRSSSSRAWRNIPRHFLVRVGRFNVFIYQKADADAEVIRKTRHEAHRQMSIGPFSSSQIWALDPPAALATF